MLCTLWRCILSVDTRAKCFPQRPQRVSPVCVLAWLQRVVWWENILPHSPHWYPPEKRNVSVELPPSVNRFLDDIIYRPTVFISYLRCKDCRSRSSRCNNCWDYTDSVEEEGGISACLAETVLTVCFLAVLNTEAPQNKYRLEPQQQPVSSELTGISGPFGYGDCRVCHAINRAELFLVLFFHAKISGGFHEM